MTQTNYTYPRFFRMIVTNAPELGDKGGILWL
jgi:hypothetical protein